jgi:hypothetical protein
MSFPRQGVGFYARKMYLQYNDFNVHWPCIGRRSIKRVRPIGAQDAESFATPLVGEEDRSLCT